MHLYLSNLVILIFILGIFFEFNANSLEILIFIAKIWDSKIYDVYRIGTGTEGEFFWWYRNRYRKKLVPEKSLGTGIGKIWYRKKVPEPVSEKFGTGKKYRYRYRKYLVPKKKYRYRYRLKFWVPSYSDQWLFLTPLAPRGDKIVR